MGLTPLTPEEHITPSEMSHTSQDHDQRPACPDAAPVIDRETLMKKLHDIPTETLRSILMNQVDLEIRLKHRELRLTEEEIGKCEAQMLALRKFFDVPTEVTFNSEPNDFTLKYYDVLNKSLSVSYTKLQQQSYQEQPKFNEAVFESAPPEPSHYRTRSTTSSLRPSIAGPGLRVAGCLYRRTDGIIVKLTCPDCHRSNFSSAQGFLNHSRIAHTKEFTSQDAAALRCGEILPDDFQDEEGLASLKNLRSKDLDPSRQLNVNEMYFDGLSSTLNTVHANATEAVSTPRIKSQPHSRTASVGSETAKGSTSRDEEENSELMKKLIRSGIAHDAGEYRELVESARQDVPNAHLFEGEVEEEGDSDNPSRGNTPSSSNQKAEPNRSGQKASEKQTSRRGIVSHTQPDNIEGARAGRQSENRHPETGGKYENRLRRRKSRSFADIENGVIRDEDEAPKRRKR
ncbi:hypothetical_protein [Candidozyma auris]|uniref:hypothetical_protein n=1 Tax=Candidozyma auris TaxID=498019 RepID=UPI000D2990F8|nr:hypothetical_protein [[Candida] auris]QEO22680.1 hypothetical_protein [[Candida] auris]GBL50915.1 hypothetical protein CAJCM15448_31890 [[Candida] auris]